MRDALPLGTASIGGLACGLFYKGENKALVTSLCAAAGGLIGLGLRQYLNEQEQLQLAEATTQTLETGLTRSIRTSQGNTITTEVVRPASARPTTSTSRPSTGSSGSRTSPTPPSDDCQTVRQTLQTAGGERHQDTVTACKKSGVWEV